MMKYDRSLSPAERLERALFGDPTRPERPKATPTKVDKWRRENPNAFYTYTVDATGGCVVQFWGYRIYYGRCADCTGLVTTRRNIERHKRGSTQTGRWPSFCIECSRKRADKHDDGAAGRMRRLRAQRKEFRDAQFAAAGLPPVRQGVKAGTW
ncbi:hypothetical protein LCL87_14940 [Rhodococcus hoagii]|nr:hypothetical protein [Prescottella equi]